ncbi:NADH:ubiquinone oxidoreductase, NDUFA5/B13 subunit [Phaffia rhodozyma]|uniref:NADH ubiquinone reductase NDUFA5 subunit n=1 Tax=Phaffia rhodozyma TaxID=264483 RepID=A0A0F7SFB8_PHARH|nr:NADH ubiquinone reductase NDUFA5 subunit [Phaffia rhodozyma]CDZ96925.1 NADH:ubiquinone oxidoreductase, NDUFA5/B13 subunit [Phaffia rhodozyma]
MRPTLYNLVKTTTKITGLVVHPNPLPALAHTYQATLKVLSHLPPSFAYRQGTEALTNSRLNVVNQAINQYKVEEGKTMKTDGSGDRAVESVEKALALGEIEEVLEIAKSEEQLAAKMLEWKAWEPLRTPTPPGQWTGFKQDD